MSQSTLSQVQGSARARWLEARQAELLDVPYFHVVFTLPAELGPLALANQRVVYNILFHAASATMLQIAAQREHLGAKIGFSPCSTPGART